MAGTNSVPTGLPIWVPRYRLELLPAWHRRCDFEGLEEYSEVVDHRHVVRLRMGHANHSADKFFKPVCWVSEPRMRPSILKPLRVALFSSVSQSVSTLAHSSYGLIA